MPHNGPDYHATITELHEKQRQDKIDDCARGGQYCKVCPKENMIKCEHHPGHQDAVKAEGPAWDAAG